MAMRFVEFPDTTRLEIEELLPLLLSYQEDECAYLFDKMATKIELEWEIEDLYRSGEITQMEATKRLARIKAARRRYETLFEVETMIFEILQQAQAAFYKGRLRLDA